MSSDGGGGERLPTEAVVGLGESNRVILAAQVQYLELSSPSSGRTSCSRLSTKKRRHATRWR